MATSPIYSWPEPDNTDLVKNGALAIRTMGNAIDTTMGTMVAKTVVDAKGDLIVGTAADTVGRLPVAENGSTIVADSSTSTGLRYTSLFGANKNKIINGDFFINQRNYTTGTANGEFVCDRNRMFNGDGTVTATYQTFTLGAAPVAGYEARNYISIQSTGQTLTTANSRLAQDIESVRTFAGQTVTVSFFAKAATGTPKLAIELVQEFGTGGSPSSAVNTYAGQVTLTTSWARYSVSIAVPSISGKTLGTSGNDFLRCALWASAGSSFNSRTGSIGIQTNTIDFWGLQVEAGSVATPFQTATGTIQGELAACQRYLPAISGLYAPMNGFSTSTTSSFTWFTFPVTPRVVPTGITVSSVSHFQLINAAIAAGTPTAIAFDSFNNGLNAAGLTVTTTAGSPTTVQGQGVYLRIVSASGSILFTGCEL